MNKAQRNAVAESLTAILRKLEKCEDRLAAAQEDGNGEAVVFIRSRIEYLSAELKGADSVLTMLGYVRRYHDDNELGHYTIEKI